MPYTLQKDRDAVNRGEAPQTVGDLNYGITRQCDAYLVEHGRNYANINSVIGVLTVVQLGHHAELRPVEVILADQIDALVDAYTKAQGHDRMTCGVVGVLECAKLELYRRVAAPYEDVKIRENGDVYSEAVLV